MTVPLKVVDEYHISLTRTVVLRHHWIEPFIESVQQCIKVLPRSVLTELVLLGWSANVEILFERFSVIFLTPFSQMLWQFLRIGHDPFLLHASQLSSHLTLYNLSS